MNSQELLTTLHQTGKTEGNTVSLEVNSENFASLSDVIVNTHKISLSLLYGTDERKNGKGFGVHALFSLKNEWLKLSTFLDEKNPRYPALTCTVMAAHWYERYLRDMFGIEPVGHPDLRRLVHHENIPENTHPLRKDFALDTKLEHANVPYPMHHVVGEGIFEIPVGPIHAGIIEPGHFRFNVGGERIITLEGKLFFTHKGVEKLLEGKTVSEALVFIERLSCDMSSANALAFVQAIESMENTVVSARAKEIRTIFGELERITMHIHDIANMGGMGTGYTFMAAQGFRVKERLMRLSERVCGNRFWRGVVVLGGTKDVSSVMLHDIRETLKEVYSEMKEILSVGLSSDGLRERLETTGILPLEAAVAFGAKGLPARASGLDSDVRRDHPYAAYTNFTEVVVRNEGDVYARFMARVAEIDVSVALIEKLSSSLSSGEVVVPCHPQNGFGIGAVESWRGEILTVVYLKDGVIERCMPRDPSFCNWALFGILGPGNIVPDFPLCNKSLNLSYSGTDM